LWRIDRTTKGITINAHKRTAAQMGTIAIRIEGSALVSSGMVQKIQPLMADNTAKKLPTLRHKTDHPNRNDSAYVGSFTIVNLLMEVEVEGWVATAKEGQAMAWARVLVWDSG